jgi:hypothetical protein
MTPELKTACEVVFQEHKLSGHPIKWDRDSFRGRISIGLSEMAKVTLVKKNIILSNKAKKVLTQLNPDVAAAGSFEEAEKMIETKIPGSETVPVYTTNVERENIHTNHHAVEVKHIPSPTLPYKPHLLVSTPATNIAGIKWYMKPIYLYLVWPLCGAAGGVLISLLMNFLFTELFK